jgi:Ca2+-transporting ATPase
MCTADAGDSPLQQRLEALGNQLGIGALIVCGIVFVVGMIYGLEGEGEHKDQPLWLQMLLMSVSLAVAAVPEGLPAAVTITLALGLQDMVKKNALIRNLHSVETLGCCNVVCSDKTGTLTKGEMTMVRLFTNGKGYQITGSGFEPIGDVAPLEAVGPAVKAQSDLLKASPQEYNGVKLPLLLAAACSNATVSFDEKKKRWIPIGNSSEVPMVVAAEKVGIKTPTIKACFGEERTKENPFNSERKMMSVLCPIRAAPAGVAPGSHIAIVKGAPNVLLQNCTSVQVDGQTVRAKTQADEAALMKTVDAWSGDALRVLAVAYKVYKAEPANKSPAELEQGLTFCGLVASIDPAREEVPGAIKEAHEAGIRVVMITGDYLITARAIAKNINLIEQTAGQDKSVDCAEIREHGDVVRQIEDKIEKKTATQQDLAEKKKREDILDSITVRCDVYARAKPEDKITIVKSLQRQNNICSMTGDGVNDAPALKQADIGVAMGITGTDVSKAAAAMVLTDDNFCSIIGAIEQGRIIYSNIQKFVFFLISCNISEILIIFFCIISGLAAPMNPIQLLWMNLVTDGAPALALAMEPGNKSILKEQPRPKDESIIDRMMFVRANSW